MKKRLIALLLTVLMAVGCLPYVYAMAEVDPLSTRFLPEDVHPKIPQIMGGIQNYSLLTAPVLQKPIPKLKRIFDNSKITDHHAIIPTGVLATNMTHEEFNVYDIVTRCFIANFYPECQISTTTVEGESAQVGFKTSGKEIVDPG